MLPKHKTECELEPPFQRAYYENQYGAKSIGEPKWKPHIRNALDFLGCQEHSPKGGNGLDWFSSIRCPELVTPEKKEWLTVVMDQQKWTLTTEHVHEIQPKPTTFKEETEKGNWNWSYERTLEETMGRRKKVEDVRNGIGQSAPGDKSYYAPECKEAFHHHGSTLPVANFGTLKTVPDTFIPLVKFPLQPRISFHAKVKGEEKAREINEVKQLDFWMPAEPLGLR